ncbi:carboxypeptidase-like regulatory domain-containing protein [Saccharospirillum alexandrii]|uniref:carboxypeptidase-like regulatory domain-containing protein n=1 Tax=Saccharospirillum alexandrii TaxID=2448477 RepID=UPI000FD98B92|nr:carboxypeptidase-like regulatory domain-containing protein [Saccharospirillum alexandrii]
MQIDKFKMLTAASLSVLLLTACIPESTDDEDSASTGGNTDTNTEENFCRTETVTTTIVPEVVLTDVDDTEQNDTGAQAQVISVNSTVSGYLSGNAVGVPGTDFDDYYLLSVVEGQVIDIQFEFNQGTTNHIYLKNGDDSVVDNTSGDNVKKINYTVPSGMTELTIFLTADYGSGDYTLTVKTPAEPVEVTNTQTLECYGDMTGHVSDAITGDRLANTAINLRSGHDVKAGDISETGSTNAQGEYEFSNVEAGDYTVEVVLAGYSTAYKNITIEGMSTLSQYLAIAPSLPEGQMRLVLTWGATPRDLDSHLLVPNGASTEHLFYGKKSVDGASLDRDDASAYGPETITITNVKTGTYTYYIYSYSGGSNFRFSNSDVEVSLYDDTGLIAQMTPPEGVGYQWNVLTFDGTLTIVNTIE